MKPKSKKKQYALVPKFRQHVLEMRTITGESGQSYLVMRTPKGEFHVFVEIATKKAAEDCGCKKPRIGTSPDEMWESLFKEMEK
ncbi:MAG: hypothetical protein Q8N09_01675 [Thermodesulfovibrionia bacterium]|nr:hypothetical protein [Thermodesulfovibrionia bacterium]